MECIVPGKNLKMFSQGLRCLGKIGTYLYIQGNEEGIIFRTLNTARSALISLNFGLSFFSFYKFLGSDNTIFTQRRSLNCQVLVKPCLSVFRSISAVEKCAIGIDFANQVMKFQLFCNHGITKTSKLSFEECQPIQAAYDHQPTNFFKASAKMLVEGIHNFNPALEEIKMSMENGGIHFASYFDSSSSEKLLNSRYLMTSVTLNRQDFMEFMLSEGSSGIAVIFSLKDFRVLLGLFDSVGLPIMVLVNGPGRPIILKADYFNAFSIELVLATLIDQNSQNSQYQISTHESQSQKQKQASSTGSQQKQTPISLVNLPSEQSALQASSLSTKPIYPKQSASSGWSNFYQSGAPSNGVCPGKSSMDNNGESINSDLPSRKRMKLDQPFLDKNSTLYHGGRLFLGDREFSSESEDEPECENRMVDENDYVPSSQ